MRDGYSECLAIIGISCRFPGASDHRSFWKNLREGREDARSCSIEGKHQFDWGFFNLAPKDAELMDPQCRLLLLHSWQAIEDAGYSLKEVEETGVYMSASNNYYQALLKSSRSITGSDEYQAWLFAQGGTIPTRISYELGLKGPSFFIHSNCSSGLSALSVATKSLLLRESKYALVGASTVFSEPGLGSANPPGWNLPSDGPAASEGVAVMLVKRAVDAIEDGDHIYALLRGVAVNNAGLDKAGYGAPSVRGQAAVIQRALVSTGVDPETIGYVEAHGTGTRWGDPVAVSALADVYRQYTPRKRFCALGPVRPSMGHLDTVTGLSSCIKVALMLKHGEIPPSSHHEAPNPESDFDDTPFYAVKRLTRWPDGGGGGVRRAAVSSFGIGGTNAHAILEAYPAGAARSTSPGGRAIHPGAEAPGFVVPLSAKSEERVRESAARLLAYLEESGESAPDLADLSFTLQVGREAMASRLAFVAKSVEGLVEALRRYLRSASEPGECFSGQRDDASDLVRFVEDDDAAEILARWIHAGKLQRVAAIWAKGVHVDWRLLYGSGLPRRISLPTYPFAEDFIARAEVPEPAPARELEPASIPGPLHAPANEDAGPPPRRDDDLAPPLWDTSPLQVSAQEGRGVPASEEPADDARVPPRTELEKTLASLWSEVLGIQSIHVDDDFFELGGQSMYAMELVTRIATATGRRIPFRKLFEARTIAQLARHLEALDGGTAEAPGAPASSLVTDISLDSDIVPARFDASSRAPETVLVTGATGFLGAFLTGELLRRTRARIICLVRAPDEQAARARLRETFARYELPLDGMDSRLEVVCGDLSGGRQLGLEARRYDELTERVDAIFHMGAHVNFAHPYRALREANVVGTRNVLRFAAARRPKPLHLASTVAIFNAARYAEQPVVREDDAAPHGNELRSGYQQSKWAADRIAALAIQRGLPVTIHRPATVGGHSVTGAWNRSDYLLNMMIACAEEGLAPDRDFNLQFSPVDDVAAAMVSLASKPDSLGKAFHLVSPTLVRMSTALDLIRSLGYSMRTIPHAKWREEMLARATSRPDHVLRPFAAILADSAPAVPDVSLDTTNATRGLDGTGVMFRRLDISLMETYFNRYFREGLVSHPPRSRKSAFR